MASGNKKTTMSKLNRERRLRERRLDKQAKKDAKKRASAHEQGQPADVPSGGDDQSTPAGTESPLSPPSENPLPPLPFGRASMPDSDQPAGPVRAEVVLRCASRCGLPGWNGFAIVQETAGTAQRR
jgi:hypothetical protein